MRPCAVIVCGGVLLLVVVVSLPGGSAAGGCTHDQLELVLFDSTSTRARCLDGTPAGYYAALNKSSTDWVIFLQGGGLCVEGIDCLARSKTPLGSSTNWTACMAAGNNVAASDPRNPFSTFNRIWVPYCSGDTWSGNSTEKNPHMADLYTSGHYNLETTLAHLLAHSDLKAASRLLLTGGSAGGIGTFLNADFVAEYLPSSINVKAAPQAGYYMPDGIELYLEYELHVNITVARLFSAYVASQFDPFLDQSCVAALKAAGQDPGLCWDAPVHYQYVTTPLFVAENQFDQNQICDIMLAPCQQPYPAEVQDYMRFFGSRMNTSIITYAVGQGAPRGNAVFFPSCVSHTDDLCMLGGPQVQGQTFAQALWSWFDAGKAQQLLDDCKGDPVGSPCNKLCTCG